MIIQISAGSGPIEVRRFVSLLGARVISLCGEQRIEACVVEREGPPEAPRSVCLRAASLPRGIEPGTHLLIARSSERQRDSRKRWFASVSLHPESTPGGAHVSALALRFSACRAGGPGGQNVNKVSSAVRAHHPASGVSVRVSQERSQSANKRVAIERIRERLLHREAQHRQQQSAERRQAHHQVIRGGVVTSYRLIRDELCPV